MALTGAAGHKAGPVTTVAGEVPGYHGQVTYIGRISSFGRDFGVAVEIHATGLAAKDLKREAKKFDRFLLAKHRELELAFMEQRS